MFKKLVISVMLVLLWCSAASAVAVAPNPCVWGGFELPDNCAYQFYLHDMGSFDDTGNWVWEEEFARVHGPQLEYTPQLGAVVDENGNLTVAADWQNGLMPYVEALETRAKSVKVDRRKYADTEEDHTRLTFSVEPAVESTQMPFLYQDATRSGLFMVINPDNTILFIQGRREPAYPVAPTVSSVVWDQTGEEGVPYMEIRDELVLSTKYNTSVRDWVGSPGTDQYILQYYKFPSEVVAGETETFTIELENGEVITASAYITNTDEMPKIPAYFTTQQSVVNKSGKAVKGLSGIDIDVENIVIREVPCPAGGDALVIQWGEPDGALFGNNYRAGDPEDTFMLRVYVGKQKLIDGVWKEVYLWIDCPVQTGTVVIGPDGYQWLLNNFADIGISPEDIEISLIYRTTTSRSGEAFDGNYHNRGYSDKVLFTPNQ